MVGGGGVEPPFSDFQSGTPTAYVIRPYKNKPFLNFYKYYIINFYKNQVKVKLFNYKTQKKLNVGIEPTASSTKNRCSTN